MDVDPPIGAADPGLKPGQPFNPYKLFYGIFIPEALVKFRGVSAGAKILYGQLVRHGGEHGRCFPKQTTLAREIGVVDRQVRTYLRELRDQGFIKIRQKGLRKPNEYQCLWHPIFTGTDRKDPSGQGRKSTSNPDRKRSAGPITRESSEENQAQKRPSSSHRLQIKNTPPPTPSPDAIPRSEDTPINNLIDDDNERIEFKGDHEELAHFIEKATGLPPDGKLVEIILDRLKLREMTLREYIEDIRPRLKRLKRRAGPGFFHSQASEPARSSLASPKPRSQPCARCGGLGKTSEGQYCDCQMGRDLARVELPTRKTPQSEPATSGASPLSTYPKCCSEPTSVAPNHTYRQ